MNRKVSLIVIGVIALTVILFIVTNAPGPETTQIEPSPLPTATPAVTATPSPPPVMTPEPNINTETEPTPTPAPTPPPLNISDQHFTDDVGQLTSGGELTSLLTNSEIIRKIVRAVYGLSEGRTVREHRPFKSPLGQFKAQKVGQQTEDEQELYRIQRENYSRYASYISLLSSLNTPASVTLYHFYYPTFEAAYQELGIGRENFNIVLIRAIDVLLETPEFQEAILLVQPTVMYKFSDPALEKLPPAHKLMLRMGEENREALKLELKILRQRLAKLPIT